MAVAARSTSPREERSKSAPAAAISRPTSPTTARSSLKTRAIRPTLAASTAVAASGLRCRAPSSHSPAATPGVAARRSTAARFWSQTPPPSALPARSRSAVARSSSPPATPSTTRRASMARGGRPSSSTPTGSTSRSPRGSPGPAARSRNSAPARSSSLATTPSRGFRRCRRGRSRSAAAPGPDRSSATFKTTPPSPSTAPDR